MEMDARHVLRGRDSLPAQVLHHASPIEIRSELDDVDKPRAAVVGGVGGRRLDGSEAREQVVITPGRPRSELQDPVELLELGDPDRRLEVRPAVVEAEPDVVEPAPLSVRAPLVAQALEQAPLVFGLRHDHPALAGRHLLVRVEAEGGGRAVRADRPPLVLGPERLGGVLDQSQTVALADRAQIVDLAGPAEYVHRDDRLGSLGDRSLDRLPSHAQRHRIDIREDRRRTLEDEAVRRGDERERRCDHLVAGPDAGDVAEQMESGGAARDCGCVRHADSLGEELLEPVDRRSEREAPGAQDFEDELLLPFVGPGARERDLTRRVTQASAAAGAGEGFAYSSHCAQRSLFPFTVSRYADWISSVTGPGGPTT